ncbi:MAG: DNA-directed RNA polymerase subunit alpha [Bdellovibrionales bacterium RIFOXYD1_FULL_53_11]|nr:MAG: DNA-directed RNA polymerase subunit alpha [Bdellovibrionales bacterium RIFOXYD1_FULL_53_11]
MEDRRGSGRRYAMLEKNWRDLIKPKALDVDKDSLSVIYGKFVAKPLERGFGLTLGNSLRRVLLSSLQGASVTAIKIEGVLHEFTPMHDVTEDVAEIILNLKEVRFKMHAESVMVAIDKTGPCTITAADIVCPENIHVLNPQQTVATLGKGGKFRAEIKVNRGRGYVPAENNKTEDMPIGWIPVDSFFSPIKRVNYSVTQSRVGQRTDYDKLTFEVWTDGSIQPEDAVSLGSKILKDQLSVFLNFEEEPEPVVQTKEEGPAQFNPNLYRSVEELELSVRSANCLQNANIKYIYELVQKTEAEMLKTKNFGRKSLNEIKDILVEMGLNLGMKLDGFVPPTQPPKPADSDVDENKIMSDRQKDGGAEDDDEGDDIED